MDKFIFTCGDTNGIGPEISLKAIDKLYAPKKYKLIIPIPLNVFEFYADKVKFKFPFNIVKKIDETGFNSDAVTIFDLGNVKMDVGKPTRFSGRVSYRSILTANKLLTTNFCSAIITAPISKFAWQKAGINFPGHTELLADLTKTKKYSMMFLSQKFKCALATIHEPISKVPKLITKTKLLDLINLVADTSLNDLNISSPKIAVLGLNPHAGENGKIGSEEINKIIPAIEKAVHKGIHLDGPYVPDAFFANKLYLKYDIVIGMYHDQLLIPFKMMNFNSGVNYTAGLPIIRTSPDHGTAYDIAGTINADITSMVESFKWARRISNNRKNNFKNGK
ncbi:4-hydroxythreonine-4-phosphate dehydrogenase [hydrothermal vent metagenome]|uniref:4-hydroxythreonine-4-phosphate dehydrogenase n=1 Tax=hydrothermal vent metagenome TaxID=652676 RepID=A0A3B1BZQ2_9ZZZZ